jgi:hypothetical protein
MFQGELGPGAFHGEARSSRTEGGLFQVKVGLFQVETGLFQVEVGLFQLSSEMSI